MGCPGAAQAHATLTSSVPASGAVLKAAPSHIELRFSEAVSPLAASLIDQSGQASDIVDFSASGSLLLIALPPLDGEGTRVVSWRAISGDGHPVSGAVVFSIGAPSRTLEQLINTDPGVARVLWAVRALMFVALFFGTGGASFLVIASPLPRPVKLLCAVLVPTGLLASISVVGLQGLDALGLPLSRIGDARAWAVGFSTSYGATSIAAGIALLLGGAAVLTRGDRLAAAISALGLAAVGVAVCLSGHGSTAEPQWLMKAALFTHVTCIAWWLGALLPLAILLKQDGSVSAPPLLRFSRIIPFAIVPLLTSGVILAVVQLGWPGPSWLSPYGLILATKLALVTLLLGLASWNRWVLTAPVAKGQPAAARRHMRWSILGEMVLVVAILGLASGWRFTPPPRALAAEPMAQSTTLTMTAEGIAADVLAAPAASGPATVTITLRKEDGTAQSARSVVLSLAQPELEIQPIKTDAVATRDGVWTIEQLLIPVPGLWAVEIHVRVSDFKLVRLKGSMEIAP